MLKSNPLPMEGDPRPGRQRKRGRKLSHSLQIPERLPQFGRPPLNEVVLGVQFTPPKGYHQIHAGAVWQCFQDDYPDVQELQAIEPVFETFGLPQPFPTSGHIRLLAGAPHIRYWFMKPKGEELLQFQPDRLLHNWRKNDDPNNNYPHFERMIEKFQEELIRIENYFSSVAPQSLSITQCEISYINQIITPPEENLKPSDWLRFISLQDNEVEDFSVVFREIVRDRNGNPSGRLTCEASTAVRSNGDKFIVFSLTVRGAPNGTHIDTALSFIRTGHELIVKKFATLTTDKAHQIWE
jgi:uncharacterized protein (TIGR04255 family)